MAERLSGVRLPREESLRRLAALGAAAIEDDDMDGLAEEGANTGTVQSDMPEPPPPPSTRVVGDRGEGGWREDPPVPPSGRPPPGPKMDLTVPAARGGTARAAGRGGEDAADRGREEARVPRSGDAAAAAALGPARPSPRAGGGGDDIENSRADDSYSLSLCVRGCIDLEKNDECL